jgi:hypothetical protein
MRSLCLLPIFLFSACFTSLSQNNTGQTDYSIEFAGSLGNSDITPFWIASNKYGTVPLKANNGLLRAKVGHNRSITGKIRFGAGADLIATTSGYRNIYVQQLYAELGIDKITISIGSKENYTSLWDKELSSGDMVISTNARPVPEINISIPQFIPVPFTKDMLLFRGNFAAGKSFDNDYITRFVNEKQIYNKNSLWHHKSLYLRFADPKNNFPLTATVGIRHYAQWGGSSSDPKIGKQPDSFRDFIRIILGESGGDGASDLDLMNTLGNHFGSYDF